jgi:D-serine deaminase-like pyridoxal phosphate-dependent protein
MSASSVAIGQSKLALDTPALLVDLDVMDANIARITEICRAHKVGWRPHVKAHKTPEIAQMELSAGAIGVTCAKVGEAEVMAESGVRNILIANQIVGDIKIRRLIELVGPADPIVGVDNIANVAALAEAARGQGKELKMAIEVNIGMNRAGVEPGQPVLSLANAIRSIEGVRLVGLFAWESQATTIADPTEKEQVVAESIRHLVSSAKLCRNSGHTIDVVSCGGTGTFPYCVKQPGVTEVQVGGAIFSDMHYRTHYHADFSLALTVLATVTSRPTPTRVVVDIGRKAMSGDAAMPQPLGLPAVAEMSLNAEHTKITLGSSSEAPKVGERVEFVVGYSDSTVHLHEQIIGVRKGRVEAVWRVAARGKIQ